MNRKQEEEITGSIAKTTGFSMSPCYAICNRCGKRYAKFGGVNEKMLKHQMIHIPPEQKKKMREIFGVY